MLSGQLKEIDLIESNGCNTRKTSNNQQCHSGDLFEPDDTCGATFMRIFNVRNDHNKYGSSVHVRIIN